MSKFAYLNGETIIETPPKRYHILIERHMQNRGHLPDYMSSANYNSTDIELLMADTMGGEIDEGYGPAAAPRGVPDESTHWHIGDIMGELPESHFRISIPIPNDGVTWVLAGAQVDFLGRNWLWFNMDRRGRFEGQPGEQAMISMRNVMSMLRDDEARFEASPGGIAARARMFNRRVDE